MTDEYPLVPSIVAPVLFYFCLGSPLAKIFFTQVATHSPGHSGIKLLL